MRILSVVGARPQFVKLSPISTAMRAQPSIEHTIVHTGQHYDSNMSDIFFERLQIPLPNINLDVGSGSHGVQTGRMLAKMDAVIEEVEPDLVLVYGDTNSTLAGAISAVKLQIPVAHVEAGLRSFNRAMPEEHNRILTDHASDLLLAPTHVAAGHLAREGLGGRTKVVGDVIADVCLLARDLMHDRPASLPAELDRDSPYLVATIHRAENTNDPQRLANVIKGLHQIGMPIVLVAHPRLSAMAAKAGIGLGGGDVYISEPLDYHELVATVMGSQGVVTDSGGLQKEAYILGKLCTTVRAQTEWVETLTDDWNVLCPEPSDLRHNALRRRPSNRQRSLYGDGHAADSVVKELISFLG